MIQTEFKIDEKVVGYEIGENGYNIYLGDKLWISQSEPYIPYPELGYEGSCLKQIQELTATPTEDVQNQASVEELQAEIAELKECILEMSQVVYA